jgi:2-oxoisovalerate dehydrogenase E1 component alpha subunit
MYWLMLMSRRLDERAWKLHRDGRISYHVSCIGHEAVQVAAAFALQRGHDWVVPYYRDLALMFTLGLTAREYMLSLMAKRDDVSSGGRQMPAHWNIKRANVVSHSSSAGSQTSHAVGIALGIKMEGGEQIVLATCGEGATSQGEWYGAVNFAAVKALPVVFLVENNRYALSTPQEAQMAVEDVADKAKGLGLMGVTVDGTDLIAVYEVVSEAVERARRGQGPTLVEAKVHRITPHSSDDDDRTYRTRKEVENARRKDPLLLARRKLEKEGLLSVTMQAKMEAKAKDLIEDAVEFASEAPLPSPEDAAIPVYAEDSHHE